MRKLLVVLLISGLTLVGIVFFALRLAASIKQEWAA